MSYFPIGKGLSTKLDKLEHELERLKSASRDALARHQAAEQDLAALEVKIVEGHEQDALAVAAGQPADPDRARVHAEYAVAKEKPQEIARQYQGIQKAIGRKEGDLQAFVAANIGELLATHGKETAAVFAELRAAMEATRDAVAKATVMEQRSTRLVAPLDGIDGRDVASVNLSALRHALDSTELVLPLPRSLISEHDLAA